MVLGLQSMAWTLPGGCSGGQKFGGVGTVAVLIVVASRAMANSTASPTVKLWSCMLDRTGSLHRCIQCTGPSWHTRLRTTDLVKNKSLCSQQITPWKNAGVQSYRLTYAQTKDLIQRPVGTDISLDFRSGSRHENNTAPKKENRMQKTGPHAP